MSVKVMGMVWESGLPKNMKMALLAYADHANDDGTSVFPGEEIMAEKTSDSPGNVRKVTKLLLEDGVLVQTKRGYRGQRAEFRINLKRLGAHIARHSETRKGAHHGQERRALEPGKARTTDTPNHHEPSLNHQPEVEVTSTRPRDELWDAFTAIHGDPATKSERGKFNKAVSKLREAGVTGDEYPSLVLAYTSKHDGLQPAVFTIANERVTEMRQFLKLGPIKSVSLEAVRDEQWARDYDARQALEAK